MTDLTMQIEFLKANLKSPIVLVGLMGAGKSLLGGKLAEMLELEFVDSDAVIVDKEQREISEIFATDGEDYFRDVERNTIQEIMENPNLKIIGTGGGAFTIDATRATILNSSISVFLEAELDVLAKRVKDGEGRPLLANGNPREILQGFIEKRYPIYTDADLTVQSKDVPVEENAARVVNALYNHLSAA